MAARQETIHLSVPDSAKEVRVGNMAKDKEAVKVVRMAVERARGKAVIDMLMA